MENILPWLKHQTQSSIKTYKNHLCQTAAIALKGWSSITGLERRCKESGWEKSDSDCWCVFFFCVCVCVSFLFWPPNNGTLREISGLEIPDTWKNTSKPLFLAGSSDVWQRLIRILPKRNIKASWLKKNGLPKLSCKYCWWFRNPAYQAYPLRLVVSPMIYKVLAPSQVVFSPDFWTINSMMFFHKCGHCYMTSSSFTFLGRIISRLPFVPGWE